MNKLRKRFWGYLMGMVVSVGMLVYGLWSIQVFRITAGSKSIAELNQSSFFHPWTVWNKVARAYIEATGNWDPAASAHLISRCMWTMIYGGILLFVLFTALAIVEFVRLSKI